VAPPRHNHNSSRPHALFVNEADKHGGIDHRARVAERRAQVTRLEGALESRRGVLLMAIHFQGDTMGPLMLDTLTILRVCCVDVQLEGVASMHSMQQTGKVYHQVVSWRFERVIHTSGLHVWPTRHMDRPLCFVIANRQRKSGSTDAISHAQLTSIGLSRQADAQPHLL